MRKSHPVPEDLVNASVLGSTSTLADQAARKKASREDFESLQEEFLAQLLQDGDSPSRDLIRASIRKRDKEFYGDSEADDDKPAPQGLGSQYLSTVPEIDEEDGSRGLTNVSNSLGISPPGAKLDSSPAIFPPAPTEKKPSKKLQQKKLQMLNRKKTTSQGKLQEFDEKK